VHAVVSNARNFGWISYGDGHFIDPYALNTSYLPGPTDKTNGQVDLLFVAFAKSPCSGKVIDTKTVLIDPCTTVPELLADELRLEINPNPADEFINCTITGLREPALLTITGTDGITHTTFIVEPNENRIVKKIDLTGYSKGLYLIRLKTAKHILTDKIVIR
jgi:hypothetical protein